MEDVCNEVEFEDVEDAKLEVMDCVALAYTWVVDELLAVGARVGLEVFCAEVEVTEVVKLYAAKVVVFCSCVKLEEVVRVAEALAGVVMRVDGRIVLVVFGATDVVLAFSPYWYKLSLPPAPQYSV